MTKKKLTLQERVEALENCRDGQGILNVSFREHLNKLSDMICEAARADGPIWKTKDGTEIRMRAMTDSHLANTIALLEKQWTKGKELSPGMYPKLDELKAEKKRRETFAANEKKWKDLHNGTGPYSNEEGSNFSKGDYVKIDDIDQKELYRLQLALRNWKNCAEYRLKEIHDQRAKIEELKKDQAIVERVTQENQSLREELEKTRQRVVEAEKGKNTIGWKLIAERRLDYIQTLKAKLDEARRIIDGQRWTPFRPGCE